MPELPEVETTLRGIAPHIINQTVCAVTVRQPKLRWQIPPALPEILHWLVVRECRRRAKYRQIVKPSRMRSFNRRRQTNPAPRN